MWKSVTISAATISLCICACCASTPPPVPGDEESGEVHISAVDSAAAASYDFLFIQMHADILAELGRRAGTERTETSLIEIRSIVEAAERTYLEGAYIVAVELLTEADELLRNIP
ncbi:MAG TPA: hypothetical protein ENO08_04370 [Candidatus Eisenbacteria bacterium]|uniref:DUF4398 domain-containing protein n=1 Tax=Eiseniibacteriota bacterium TaxID=2212470 RepID=A0A7V2AUT2_UNCEI|nr:hypothetical protein [Candidatus Eisenbacteria bacterium]